MIAQRPDEPPILHDWSSVLLFACELTWLGLLGYSGWRLGGGWWLGFVGAVVLVSGFIAFWARWMAPKSPTRLDFENRQLALIVIGSTITIISAAAGPWLVGGLSSILLVLSARRHHRLASRSPNA